MCLEEIYVFLIVIVSLFAEILSAFEQAYFTLSVSTVVLLYYNLRKWEQRNFSRHSTEEGVCTGIPRLVPTAQYRCYYRYLWIENSKCEYRF